MRTKLIVSYTRIKRRLEVRRGEGGRGDLPLHHALIHVHLLTLLERPRFA
jgi:hypothetical protein